MRRHTQYILALAVALTVLAVTAWALPPPNPYTSTISLSGLGFPFDYSNSLTAEVTRNVNGSYHYEYTLDFQQSVDFGDGGPLTDFSIASNGHPFSNQGSSDSSFQNLASNNSVYWTNGTPLPGQTLKFWYDSWWSYGIVPCTVTAGLSSNGDTLGMVPEPCSTAVMLLGIGALWAKRKRRR